VPAEIGAVVCREVGIVHHSAIFNQLNAERADEQVIDAVSRTLGAAVVKFGVLNGYFRTDSHSAGRSCAGQLSPGHAPPRPGRTEAARGSGSASTPADVDKHAAAFEEEYPDYGAQLVWLTFGTGLRINEALALRWDSINLDTLAVAVDWQLDRYGTWPALAPPKATSRPPRS
jgi:integrase